MSNTTVAIIRTARKPHQCDYCLCPIERGQKYLRFAAFDGDGVYEYKRHIHCQNLFDEEHDCSGCEGLDYHCRECFEKMILQNICSRCDNKGTSFCPQKPLVCITAQADMETIYGEENHGRKD